MTRQASCWVFGIMFVISQLAVRQTKAAILSTGLLCSITKDRVWWQMTKQPVSRRSYFQTVPVIRDKICLCRLSKSLLTCKGGQMKGIFSLSPSLFLTHSPRFHSSCLVIVKEKQTDKPKVLLARPQISIHLRLTPALARPWTEHEVRPVRSATVFIINFDMGI